MVIEKIVGQRQMNREANVRRSYSAINLGNTEDELSRNTKIRLYMYRAERWVFNKISLTTGWKVA